jgi:nucleoside-diphosphate-sugar epimerase
MAQAFVTGGSGFIGQALVRRLLGEGHSVRVLVRSEKSAARVSALGAEHVRGELPDPATWRDAVTGSETSTTMYRRSVQAVMSHSSQSQPGRDAWANGDDARHEPVLSELDFCVVLPDCGLWCCWVTEPQ